MKWIKFNKEKDLIPKGCLWIFGVNGVEFIEGGLNNRSYFTHYIKVKKPLPPK